MAKFTKEELEKLMYDNNVCCRCIAAEHKYGLDILVNDKDWRVRATVADQGV